MIDGVARIAVIGSGVSGITSAYLLQDRYHVDLFEIDNRIGGHTSTVIIPDGPDAGTPVDIGFIVLNDRTYPNLHALLKRWNVPVRKADMSFGYHDERTGMLYGSRDLSMLLARRSNLVRPAFYKMVSGIVRFWRELPEALHKEGLAGATLREFCGRRYSQDFYDHYLIPFAGAIWSASGSSVLDMPAELCARFFINHGMLSYNDNPQWQTVVGGSHSYVKAFLAQFKGRVFSERGIAQVARLSDGVELTTTDNERLHYDAVVIATHADQALTLLTDPSDSERELLGVWSYSYNRTVLHTDATYLPPLKRAVASWNYRRFINENGTSPVCVTYHMNTLMGLRTKHEYCVTLNPRREIPTSSIVKEFNYTHPEFTAEAFATQARLPELNGKRRTWFCGSYFRWGFHEDAVMSALAAVKDFGVSL